MTRSERRQRTKLVALRLLPAEHVKLSQEAAAAGTSVGGLIRQRVFGDDQPTWFSLDREFAAADYLEQRLADAGTTAGAGWCLEITRRIIRALNGREPNA